MSMLARRRKPSPLPEGKVTQHSIVTWERGHVHASVIELDQGAAELLGVAAAPVNGIGSSHPDVDRWLAGCDRALTQAEDMTQARGRKVVPDYVAMAVPAESTRSLPIVVTRQRRESEGVITYDQVCALLRRGYRQAQDVVGGNARSATEDIICGALAEIILDGQAVDDPIGLHGTQLEFRMSFWLAPLEWIRALEIVAERLELTLTAIVPQHVAYASPLPDAIALLVVIEEHCTVVNLVRHGRVQWSTLIPLGERELTETTARALDLHGRQADALMRAYRAHELRDEVELQLAHAFWAQLRAWMDTVAERITASAGEGAIPHRIYVLDATRNIPEAALSLETPYWERCLSFERCPEIISHSASSVRDVLDCTGQANGPAYLPLRSLARYVARIYAPGHNWDRALAEALQSRHA